MTGVRREQPQAALKDGSARIGAVAEFFAGMGLVRRAIEAPGGSGSSRRWRTVFANDCDPMKARLYRASFVDAEGVFNERDVRSLTADDVPAAQLWTASFPCTDLSLAGRGVGIQGGQSGAVWSMLGLLAATPPARKPDHILFENVLGLLSSHDGDDFRALVTEVARLGYGVDPMVIDAAHFTPQSRQRMFLIATRLDRDETPLVDPSMLEASEVRPARLLHAMRSSPDLPWHARQTPPLPARRALLESVIDDPPEDSPRWWSPERTSYFFNQIHPSHRSRAQRMIDSPQLMYAAGFRRIRAVAGESPDAAPEKRSVIELREDGRAGCLRTPKGGSAKQILFRAGRGRFRVRHLTPQECGRLQGVDRLPAGFTDHELLFGLGDAVCVQAVRWAMDRLESTCNHRDGSSPVRHDASLFSSIKI